MTDTVTDPQKVLHSGGYVTTRKYILKLDTCYFPIFSSSDTKISTKTINTELLKRFSVEKIKEALSENNIEDK